MSAESPPGLATRRYKDVCPIRNSEIRFFTDFKNR